jgi:hypothetical protein
MIYRYIALNNIAEMNGTKINQIIKSKMTNYIEHKIKILEERIYWACIDKIYEAQNYAEYEIDKNNNIYISYLLREEESIINQPHDTITCQIISNYRKKLKVRLTNDNFHVKYTDTEIIIYFSELNHSILDDVDYEDVNKSICYASEINSESDSESEINILNTSEKNINIYSNNNETKVDITETYKLEPFVLIENTDN